MDIYSSDTDEPRVLRATSNSSQSSPSSVAATLSPSIVSMLQLRATMHSSTNIDRTAKPQYGCERK